MTTFGNDAKVASHVHTQTVAGSVNNVTHIYSKSQDSKGENDGIGERPDAHDDAILESLAFREMFDRRNTIENPHENTCRWVLEHEHFLQWKKGLNGLLWFKGNPGSGKSTLMSFLHAQMEDEVQATVNSSLLSFFFSARGSNLQHTPLGMLRSLVYQTFQLYEELRPYFREAYQRKRIALGNAVQSHVWQQPELELLFLRTIKQVKKPTIIFVDALDEAGERTARQLARYLHLVDTSIQARSSTVKLCISCRHYPIPTSMPGMEIWMEQNNLNDIRLFINDSLQTMNQNHGVEYMDDWSALKTDIIEKARGSFQWARLVVPIVERLMLDGESPQHVRDFLKKVPSELEEVYEHIIRNVIDTEYREQSFLFFQWICFAERPLSTVELRYALAAAYASKYPESISCEETSGFIESDERMKRRIRALSGGLIEVTRLDEPWPRRIRENQVQVIHQSVNEYLLSRGLALLSTLSNHEPYIVPSSNEKSGLCYKRSRSQSTLYWCCLNYLSTASFHTWGKPFPSARRYPVAEDQEFDGMFPLANYAAIHLFTHAKLCSEIDLGDAKLHGQLLESVFEVWKKIPVRLDTIDGRRRQATTLLHQVCQAGLVGVASYLIEHKHDIFARDGQFHLPIHVAAYYGRVEIAKLLYAAGADLNFVVGTRSGWSLATPLTISTEFDNIPFVQYLLENQVDLELPGQGSPTALIKAVASRNNILVELLINAGANVNCRYDGPHLTPLGMAVCFGYSQGVQILLDAGADVDSEVIWSYNGTVLQAAVHLQRYDIVGTLLRYGADVNGPHPEFGNTIQFACSKGDAKMMKILIDAGAGVNSLGGTLHGTPLNVSTEVGSVDAVRLLLARGANPNLCHEGKALPLEMASCRGPPDIVRLLLEAGAMINVPGTFMPPICCAAAGNNLKSIRLLLDHSANINMLSYELGHALSIAALRGNVEAFQLLLDSGSQIDLYAGKYWSALQAAASRPDSEDGTMLPPFLDLRESPNTHLRETKIEGDGSPQTSPRSYSEQEMGSQADKIDQESFGERKCEIVRLLLQANANIELQGGFHGSVLHAALDAHESSTIQLLLKSGAPVDLMSEKHGTPLRLAALKCDLDILKTLLAAGADVNAIATGLAAPLQAAAYSQSSAKVKLLIEAGADVNAQSGTYGNALLAAIRIDREDIVKLLLDAGADPNIYHPVYGNALRAAASWGRPRLIETLLRSEARIHGIIGPWCRKSRPGAEQLQQQYDEKIDELILEGEFLEQLLGDHGNPLCAAAYFGKTAVMETLLSSHANVEAVGGRFGTALAAACAGGHARAVSILIDAGADVNICNTRGETPLLLSCKAGKPAITKALIDADADILMLSSTQYSEALAQKPKSVAGEIEVMLGLRQQLDVKPLLTKTGERVAKYYGVLLSANDTEQPRSDSEDEASSDSSLD